MPTSAIDSLIFRDMFGSPAMREIWSDAFRTQKYLDWEAALARAQAKVGLIPQEAADEITAYAKLRTLTLTPTRRRHLPSATGPHPVSTGQVA